MANLGPAFRPAAFESSDDGDSPARRDFAPPAARKRKAPDAEDAEGAARAPPPPPPISTPSFRVDGLNFVVTGASKGLGLAVANQLAAAGARSVLLVGGRAPSPGPARAAEWESDGGCAMSYMNARLEADAGGVDDVVAAMDRRFGAGGAGGERGALHGLVNCAGVAFPRATMAETDGATFDFMLAVNCRAPVLLMRAAARLMRARGARGAIVNVSSVCGYGGGPFAFAYSAAKAALNCATKCAAVELKPHRVRVNAVAMGWTLTDSEDAGQRAEKGAGWLAAADAAAPIGRLLRPDDLAATIGHLLSPAATMITGAIVDVCPDFTNGTLPVTIG